MKFIAFGMLLAQLTFCSIAGATVTEFTNHNQWVNAVGEFTMIDFTGFPEGTFLTNQYAGIGVLFS